MRALVVGDSGMMRKVLIGALARAGINDVDQATDGMEAVAACQNADYQLVLMDWNMPNMMGNDAIRAIRASGKTMPIIMVAIQAEKSQVVEAIKAGANDYIVKPLKVSTIVKKIQAVLGKMG